MACARSGGSESRFDYRFRFPALPHATPAKSPTHDTVRHHDEIRSPSISASVEAENLRFHLLSAYSRFDFTTCPAIAKGKTSTLQIMCKPRPILNNIQNSPSIGQRRRLRCSVHRD